MTIQCTHCQTKYRLEEKPSLQQSTLQLTCSNCGQTFSVVCAIPAEPSTPARPVPVQHHDEFNKRLRSVAQPLQPSPDSLKATMIRSSSRPWLASDKVLSLVVIDGPLKGRVFPLTKAKVLLGRSEADIVLEDSEISRKHCALEVNGTS